MQRSRPRRVLAYARVSSAIQGEHGTSLESQQEEFERFCKANGYPKPSVFVEVEGGGQEKLEKRLELHRLLAEVREGDLVLCAKQDRWSRYTLFYLQSIEQIVSAGARFFSIAERFDPSTPEGKFASTQMASVAELEHARIRDRTVGARRRLRAMGKFVEGPAPLGYLADRTTRSLEVDESRAPIVRLMFKLCVAGRSTRQISATLEDKWPDVGGLDPAGIQRKLRNRVYTGEMRPVGKRGVKPKATDEWLPATHPPLVDRVTFRRAQEALVKRKVLGRPGSEESRTAGFLLRGIVRCGHCGLVMTSQPVMREGSTQHGGWYVCRRREVRDKVRCTKGPSARHAELDAAVESAMVAHLEEVAAALAKPREPKKQSAKMADFEARKELLLARRKRVADSISKGVIDDEEARETLAEIAEDIDALEKTRAEIEDAAPEPTAMDRRLELAAVKAMRAAWRHLTVAEKRQAIGRHAAAILIYSTGKARWQRRDTWRLEATWKRF